MNLFSSQKDIRAFIGKTYQSHKRTLWLIIIFEIVQALLAVLVPYFTKLQIDQLEKQHTSFFTIITGSPLTLFVLIIIISSLSEMISKIIETVNDHIREKFRNRVQSDTEGFLFERLQTFDAGFLDNNANRRIYYSLFSLQYIFDRSLYFIVNTAKKIIQIFGILPIVAFIDLRVFGVIVICSLIQAWYARRRLHLQNQFRVTSENVRNKMSDLWYQLLRYFHKLLMMHAHGKVLSEYRQVQQKYFGLKMEEKEFENKGKILEWVIQNLPDWLTAVFAGMSVLDGKITLGDYTMLLLYARQVHGIFDQVISLIRDWYEIGIEWSRIGFFLTMKPRYKIPPNPYTGELSGTLAFQNVQFHYPPLHEDEKKYLRHLIGKSERFEKKAKFYRYMSEENKAWKELLEKSAETPKAILKEISLDVRPQTVTALVGRNGSGKTTITQLMLKNYEPVSGDLHYGSVRYEQCEPDQIRKEIAIITQEPVILENFSVRENLLLGSDREIGDKTVWELLDRLYMREFIEKADHQLDTPVGESLRLSSGQNQLLAIARTILQDRSVLIFDEGTNQLDAEHEASVIELLREQAHRHGKKVFMITHKMTTAAKADQIYIIDQGRIIEQGTHAQLLDIQGLYARFWKLQVVG